MDYRYSILYTVYMMLVYFVIVDILITFRIHFYISLKLIRQRIPFGGVLPSVADPDTIPGSRAQDPGSGAFLTP